MNTILKPIAINEKSHNITLLHKALETLGFPVAKREVSQGKAGKDTLQKVRALQAQFNVPVNDSLLLDEATARAITAALKKMKLLVASRSFTVAGAAKTPIGDAKKRQRLLAFDLDLRGVSIYRTAQNLSEIQQNGGFEFLGEACSDTRGNYSITFYDWQYGQAERKKADVVVYAVNEDEIIGHSRMVNSEDYSDKGLVRDLDVIITQTDKRTEYEVLMSALTVFLEESQTSLGEIGQSQDQLIFTAGELDLEFLPISIAASAELLAKDETKKLSHELLYGIGRQDIRLSWSALFKKQEEELRRALNNAIDQRIISEHSKRNITLFLKNIQDCAAKHLLEEKAEDGPNTLNTMLKHTLPEVEQRVAFVKALNSFKGNDFREFWNEHLPNQAGFVDRPELISGLLLTQQLTLLTGNHQTLVEELQLNLQITSMHRLLDLNRSDWVGIIRKAGTPDFVQGKNEEEKINNYTDLIQNLLNVSFPTQRIAKMVKENKLCIEKTKISRSISTFLSKNEAFDFASSRIHDFDKEMKAVAGNDFDEVRSELMKIQRVFQVSTSPEAMNILMENNLHSASAIANIPPKSFSQTYGGLLGGEAAAFEIHQRASHINTKAEITAMHLMEYSDGLTPAFAMGPVEFEKVKTTLQNKFPNYSELFGSPDVCECKHCRSVYSAAAYFIDLLRFLWRGKPNSSNKTPLDMLAARRPDLLHLQLTCENTNTLVPYIDLANEVMEYYVAHDSLTNFKGHDTGEASVEELRANPQHFNLKAYSKLKDAKFPFNLPYHQPLDVIRTYSEHLKVSRYEVLRAMNPQPDATTSQTIAAESLRLSQEEYLSLTGKTFDGTTDNTSIHKYFGYTTAGQLENLSSVPEFLKRSGLIYTDLVKLVKTRFINPHQGTLDFLQKLFSYASIDPDVLYKKLRQIETGAPANDNDVKAALNAYNSGNGANITPAEFAQWIVVHFAQFKKIVTLYEPDSKCDLDTTKLKTLQNIYEGAATSGITSDAWSKMHRFIRLSKKLGWTIYETDLMLAALGENDITPETIRKLEWVSLLKVAAKLPLNQLAVLWGAIDTDDDKSLYKKLFLNKAAQQIDEAFKADEWGDYLQKTQDKKGNPITLAKHRSAILAAFRLSEKDLQIILKVAKVNDVDNSGNKTLREINFDVDILNLQNLSTIYRYVLLAKALKMQLADLCKVIGLFDASPFSVWDIQLGEFTGISPKDAYIFYKLAASTKTAGFKPAVLEYILKGVLPAKSAMGLNKEKTLQMGGAIRDAFDVIEQDHPKIPDASMLLEEIAALFSLTPEIITAKLSLTFQPGIVMRFMAILEGTAIFETFTDKNLNVIIPDSLAAKYAYIKKSGRLRCIGVMSDAEQISLQKLQNVSPNFISAVAELYHAPEIFIGNNLKGVFSNLVEANKVLLNHNTPPLAQAVSLGGRLAYIYKYFIPLLKNKLRKDAITQHIAPLIDLSEEATALLIAEDMEQLVSRLSVKGLSATYFSDTMWNNAVPDKTDGLIDFSWGNVAPHPQVPANAFSVRWQAYLVVPASAEYTLMIEVEDPSEAFKLFIDGALIREKTPANPITSLEVLVDLNAANMHVLVLEYARTTQKAGIRLSWKTDTKAPEIVPDTAFYPKTIVDDFVAQVTVYHRAAKFISGFSMSETELNHCITYTGDFDNINFKKLKAVHWNRINDYVTLRNAAPQSHSLLTDLFALANRSNPQATVQRLTGILHLATGWDEAGLTFLVNKHFKLGVNDFKNEKALNRIKKVIQIISKTGISAETIAEWGAVENDFNKLYSAAQKIKNTVKSKYEEKEWLELAGNLSNKLRENQQQALVCYLLTRPEIQNWGAKDADSLFEYFLIDVQMGACMDTSRIVQANAAVQMFANRCLLNLESDMSGGSEKGVSPETIDKDRWEWMKNYRVWEANRKVFLYPENWLEPEWRTDRSEFFRDLESYLLQNDITTRSVERALRNYLTSLNEVANLEVCGMYQEYSDDDTLKYLHVFARTNNAPYKFFYRRWNQYRKWSAWERVQLDIRNEEDGENSGVHLIPAVWKKRLFLFWPEFMELQKNPSKNSSDSVEDASGKPMSHLEAKSYWEIRLAWSEYVDGKWVPKQVSKESIKTSGNYDVSSYQWIVDAYDNSAEMIIYLQSYRRSNKLAGEFRFRGIENNVSTDDWPESDQQWKSFPYQYHFMKLKRKSELEINNNFFLEGYFPHELLYSNNFQYPPKPNIEYPFFYHDKKFLRTYFVRPVNETIIAGIKSPESYTPYIQTNQVYGSNQTEIGTPTPSENAIELESSDVTAIAENRGTIGIGVEMNVFQNYEMEVTNTGKAFGSLPDLVYGVGVELVVKSVFKGLEFHTFYHPFSSKFVTRLNSKGGISSLMQSDTEDPSIEGAIISDEGSTFEKTYLPNFKQSLVIRHNDFDNPPDPRTAYKENVCFDVYGANSLYNWELFFHAPLYIAARLSKNGKYEEATKWFHYIFDPTTDEAPKAGESEISRYWKVPPFKSTPAKRLEDWFNSLLPNADPTTENAIIGEWRDNPFDPHLIASNRPLAYMKQVVVKYVENLLAWGDSLFRQFTRESVYEALQIYVIANHILGSRPEFAPKRGQIKAETYSSLQSKWDDFSNALVQLENLFPYSSEASVSTASSGTNLLGLGPALYFCIPANDKLIDYWDTVADRLFKIRHCQDIEGVERALALFAPPIDPAVLIQARSQGLSLGSILADLSSPPPIYRFSFLIQKANEFCREVKELGSTLLIVLEKKDAEELNRLRASHENQILELVTAVRERQVLDAKVNKENQLKARNTAEFRRLHYIKLLDESTDPIPSPPMIEALLTANSRLPVDTGIINIKTNVDESLVNSDERGVKIIGKEKEEIDKSNVAMLKQEDAMEHERTAGYMNLIPGLNVSINSEPLGVGASFGGTNVAGAISAYAKSDSIDANRASQAAVLAAKTASYIRREQDWTLQANLASKEIIQVDKQITSADIRIQVAEKELENHKKQIENAKTVELFLKDKFTNQELYQWIKEQLFAVYKQSYNLAFELAKKAEKAYQYEMGVEKTNFITYGYWDNSRQGLVAGKKLQLALRQLEKSYMEENRRELEMNKSVSLALLDPLALIALRETGKCYVSIPEELFDLDFQSHYFRRIKSVSLSIPCIAGPYTTVNCTLRLLKNTIRVNTSNGNDGYKHNQDEGYWTDDNRFRGEIVPVTSISTSTGQNDAGMFEFNFRDERYLPFEGAGAISDWQIELTIEKELRQFDYSTISDVILHIKYTAREGGASFKADVIKYMKNFLKNALNQSSQPLMRMFSMRHEFPSEWHKFLHTPKGSEQVLSFTIGKERFPFLTHGRKIIVMEIDVFAKCAQEGTYHLMFSYTDRSNKFVASTKIDAPKNDNYGELNKSTINLTDTGLNIEELDIAGKMSLMLKHNSVADYKGLTKNEVKDLFWVFHYKLDV